MYSHKTDDVLDHEILDAFDVLEGTNKTVSSRIRAMAKDLESDKRYDGEIVTSREILRSKGWNT